MIVSSSHPAQTEPVTSSCGDALLSGIKHLLSRMGRQLRKGVIWIGNKLPCCSHRASWSPSAHDRERYSRARTKHISGKYSRFEYSSIPAKTTPDPKKTPLLHTDATALEGSHDGELRIVPDTFSPDPVDAGPGAHAKAVVSGPGTAQAPKDTTKHTQERKPASPARHTNDSAETTRQHSLPAPGREIGQQRQDNLAPTSRHSKMRKTMRSWASGTPSTFAAHAEKAQLRREISDALNERDENLRRYPAAGGTVTEEDLGTI